MPSNFYTGRGDDGTTSILAGGRLWKDDPIVDAIGDVDELNSAIGETLCYVHEEEIRRSLKLTQNELFVLGANLASIQSSGPSESVMKKEYLNRLEQEIESISAKVPQMKQFVIPGGCEGAVHLQAARAIARRAERSMVTSSKKYKIDGLALRYINRASSFLFAAAIYLNFIGGIGEEHPTY